MLVRPTARVVVLDPAGRVLLFKVEDRMLADPCGPRVVEPPRLFWIAPGGGVEEGETFEDAARRELREETGIVASTLGPCVFEHDKILWDPAGNVLFRTRYFPLRVATVEVVLGGQDAGERATHRGHHWWSPEELERTDKTIYPPDLPTILRCSLAVS